MVPSPSLDTNLSLDLRITLDGRWRSVRDSSREYLDRADMLPDPSLSLHEARARTLRIMRELVPLGLPQAGFRTEHGGTGDVGAAITAIEMLGYADLSLMVKAGVQWGLFGGAIENLGTTKHHDQYVIPLINLDVLGCFAMTETGHGSDVQALQTVARYDPAAGEFVITSEGPLARKDYIGGAAQHASVATVFAQLVTGGPGQEPSGRGVHCFVVPIRDAEGNDLPGVTTSDCGYKGGLAGVDNGRIIFDEVRVPRESLLNRYADVAEDGAYSSPIESENKRFFTMLGTLIRGRVSVAATSGAAARKALTIASRYAFSRKQFEAPDGTDEVIIADYLVHQRKLLPLIARSYALAFAQNELTEELHEVQTSEEPDPHRQRELESAAAGLKAMTSWHAQNAITQCREACGGAGYLDANQLTIMRRDIDVFTTFEGDNTVLTQLVAKELLSAYAEDVQGLNAVGWTRFIASTARDVFLERSVVRQVVQSLLDSSDENVEESELGARSTQLRLLSNREDHLLRTAAARLRKAQSDDNDPFEVFNNAQDHIVKIGSAHTERVVLEAFIAAIDTCDNKDATELLNKVCDLYAYSAIEADLPWFLMHRQVSPDRAKAIRQGVNQLCAELRPHWLTLVEAFGVPEKLLSAEMLTG